MRICAHCKKDTAIRNPSGFCDHLYYPECCEVCKEAMMTPKERMEKAAPAMLAALEAVIDEFADCDEMHLSLLQAQEAIREAKVVR